MNKLINIFVLIGLVFLVFFWIMNPMMGLAFFIICVPFLVACILSQTQTKKFKKERDETVISFQREKEEIINGIRRKVEKQKGQYEQLMLTGKELSGALNKEQLLHLIVNIFAKNTKTPSGDSKCFLLSHDLMTGEFVYEVGYNFDRNTLRLSQFKDSDEILKNVLKARKIITHLSDLFGGDSNISYFLKEERFTYLTQLGSLALIPLILEDEVWGIIVIFCHEDAAAQIKNDEAFFLLLVAQASIALGSAIHRGLASIDRLTQLYNRTFLQKRLKEELEFCNRQQWPLSLLMIDIDHFKEINDTYGHQEGDIVLKKIAQLLSNSVRLTDICARYGGEEFVVVLPGIAECANDNLSIGERLRLTIEKSDFIVLDSKHIKLTISVGVIVRRYPEEKDLSIDELIKSADALLYKAKKEGRNKVCFSL